MIGVLLCLLNKLGDQKASEKFFSVQPNSSFIFKENTKSCGFFFNLYLFMCMINFPFN